MSDTSQGEVSQSPTPPVSNGAQELIAKAEMAINGAHDAVMQHIDEMIAKLQSVKQSVQVKKEGAVASLREFVGLAAHGLETVKLLEQDVAKLIRNHLTA